MCWPYSDVCLKSNIVHLKSFLTIQSCAILKRNSSHRLLAFTPDIMLLLFCKQFCCPSVLPYSWQKGATCCWQLALAACCCQAIWHVAANTFWRGKAVVTSCWQVVLPCPWQEVMACCWRVVTGCCLVAVPPSCWSVVAVCNPAFPISLSIS